MKTRKIIVLDDSGQDSSVRVDGRRHRCEIRTIPAGERILWSLAADMCEVFIVDVGQLTSSGGAILELFGDREQPPIILATTERITDAIEVAEVGVFDYIERPFTFPRLLQTIERALDYYDLLGENRQLRQELRNNTDGGVGPVVTSVADGVEPRLESDVRQTFETGSVREMERLMILERLERLAQNRTHAAKSLEISVRTLRNKLKEYREAGLIQVPSGR